MLLMSVTVDAQNLQRVEHEVAQILAERDVPVEVYAATLEAIGRMLGFAASAPGTRATGHPSSRR